MNERHDTSTIDERFLSDWFEFGMRELSDYLSKHARFDAFCDGVDAEAA